MALWLLIENAVAIDGTDVDPTGRFHASYQWVPAPDGTPLGSRFDGKVFSPPIAALPTLAGRRADLANERYQREIAGVSFRAAGASSAAPVATDAASQAKMTAAFVIAGAGLWTEGAPWKMADGSFVPLAADDVKAMAIKAQAYVAACYAHEAQLSAALASDLSADITQGWPASA